MKKLTVALLVFGSSYLYPAATIDLGETVIKSNGYYRPSMKENNGKVIITENDIQKKNYSSVVSIFEDSPLTVIHHTPFGPVVDLRGSGERTISRVKVMLDGVAINPLEEAMGSIPFDAIPIDSIGRVEVSPGTGTTLYGGGTTGGTINIITKGKKQNDYITLNGGASSYSTYDFGGAGGFNVTKDLFINVAEYYRNGKGYRDNEKTERTNFIGGFDWKFSPKQSIALQTNLYRENAEGSTELDKKELQGNRTKAGEKTKSEVDRRGYSLDYNLKPNDNFNFKFNINGAEFDRDVYQHGKQALMVFPNKGHNFYLGNSKPAMKNNETDLKGKFDEKVRGAKVQGEWFYNDKKGKLTFGYEYKNHELKREADMEQVPYKFSDMGIISLNEDGKKGVNEEIPGIGKRDNRFLTLAEGTAYISYLRHDLSKLSQEEKNILWKNLVKQSEIDMKRLIGETKVNTHVLSGSDVFKKTHSLYALNEYQWNDKLRLKGGFRWEHSTFGGKRYNNMLLQFSDLKPGLINIGINYLFDLTDAESKGIDTGELSSIEKTMSFKTLETYSSSDDFGGELGFTYEYSPKGNVYFRYERGFVSPTPSQLTNKDFLTGVYYPSDVKSEKVDTVEVGTKRFLGRNSFVAGTLFFSLTHDEITLIDFNGNNPMNRRWAYTNLMETQRYGLELQAQHWIGKWKFKESLTFTDARISKDSSYRSFLQSKYSGETKGEAIPFKKGDKVPMVSDLKVILGADYQWTEKFTTGISYTYVSGYEIKTPSENFQLESYKIKGHGVVDVHGRYNFTDYASIRFGVNNLLGEKYNLREDGQFAVPAPERNYFVGFSYKF